MRGKVWWVTLLGAVIGLALLVAGPGSSGPMFDASVGVHLGPFDIPSRVAIAAAATVVLIVGLIWLVRILEGPGEDEPPPWRYRDR
jgi:hypothetical protein